jgi:hypothetical protein
MRILPILGLLVVVLACSSSSKTSSGGGGACVAAGGTCQFGDIPCETEAADSAQDCNTNPPNPSGGFCCLVEGNGSACKAAGGVCTGEDVPCATQGSDTQDCALPLFCCLALADAGPDSSSVNDASGSD